MYSQILEEGHVTLKRSQWQSKQHWEARELKHIQSYVTSTKEDFFITGRIGIWMQPYVFLGKTALFMFMLDIEHPNEHHTSLLANIKTAQSLFYSFDELGLTKEMVVGLSGSAFRFVCPWLIPNEYSKAFKEMINDSRRFPGIDTKPQQSTSNFFRLMAYRGHTNQGKKTQDVHVHYLDNAYELLDLNESRYRELTAGKPDLQRHITVDMPRIIPRSWAPPEMITVLEQYQFQLNIKSTIATSRAPRINQNSSVNWEEIMDYLRFEGYKYEKHEYNSIDIIKLDACPECGESEGNPYITPSGKLKCFRSNSCAAGRSENGLKPSEWIPGYSASNDETQTTIKEPQLQLSEAREILKQGLQSTNHVCINASPGVGKTTQAIKTLTPQAKDKLILYTLPTHALAQEVSEKIKAIDKDVAVVILEGRNKDNCQIITTVSSACSRGFSPSKVLCYRCDYKDECAYLEQFGALPEKGFILAAHQMAPILDNKINPDIWVIDENPLQNFFRTVSCTQLDMDELSQKEPADIQKLFSHLKEVVFQAAAKLNPGEQARLYVGQTPPGPWEDACSLENIYPEMEDYFQLGLFPSIYSKILSNLPNDGAWEYKVFKNNIDMNAVKWWEAVIDPEKNHNIYIKTWIKDGVQISYNLFEDVQPQFENCQIIHLDGTLYEPEATLMFWKDTQIIDAQASLESCRKVHIQISRGKWATKKLEEVQIVKDLQVMFKHLRAEDKKVLLLTFKDMEDKVLRIAKELMPDREFGSFHFWGPRGVNDYENFDACLSYGTPSVGALDVADYAMYLFEEQYEQLDWVASLGRRDLVQCIHRIRPVKGNKNIVIMGSYWPTEYLGQPDHKEDLMRKGDNFHEAKERLLKFARDYGFVNIAVANMLAVGTEKDENAINAWHARIARAKGGPYDPFSTLIRYIYKSGEENITTPPAILLRGNNQWKKLLEAVREETGLEMYWHKSRGRGGKSWALGRIEKVMEFYELIGSQLDTCEPAN